MLSLLFCFFFNYTEISTFDADPSLDASLIPDSLHVDAHAVIRYEHELCEIKSLYRKVITKEKAITILNQRGVSAGVVSIYYTNKIEKVRNLEIEIFDAKGELIKKVKEKEINDLSVFDGFSIAGDRRQKYYSYTSNSYPYTIKFKYVEESENTLWIPRWYPIPWTGVSVESSTFEIFCSIPEMSITHSHRNFDNYQIEANVKDNIYEAKNLKAIKYENLAPHYNEYLPFAMFIPDRFNFFGIEGAFSDWHSYGKWMNDNMLEGRGTIPPELILELDAMIPEGSTNNQIARIIYDYVTESTRYVSVQLGVGGFMPFTSEDVYNLKYGDCKALSFYTSNLLKHYGVESIYTEIMSERDYAVDYDEDIYGPGQGNHIVLCLPNEGDTTWLECTTSSTFFGYAHSGIDNRRALMITPEGGKLIKTTKYSLEQNLAEKKAKITIDSNNVAGIDFENTYHHQRHEPRYQVYQEKGKKREELLRKYFFDHLPVYDLVKYKIDLDEKAKLIKEKAHLEIKNLVETAGEYLIIPYMVEYIHNPSQMPIDRVQDIYIKNEKSDKVEIEILIPEGYTFIEKEESFDFKNSFGSLKVNKEKIENRYRITVDIEYYAGLFDPMYVFEYNEFSEKLKNIYDDKLVLKPI